MTEWCKLEVSIILEINIIKSLKFLNSSDAILAIYIYVVILQSLQFTPPDLVTWTS